MKWSNKIPLYAFLIALICSILASVLKNRESRPDEEYERQRDTITITRTDTIYDTIQITKWYPKPVKEEVIKHDTIKGDTVLERERKVYTDTIKSELDTISIEAEVEGIDVQLNYLKAQLKKGNITTTQTQTITNTITKKKKGLIITPNVSVGYGLLNKKMDIYVGVGIGYVF